MITNCDEFWEWNAGERYAKEVWRHTLDFQVEARVHGTGLKVECSVVCGHGWYGLSAVPHYMLLHIHFACGLWGPSSNEAKVINMSSDLSLKPEQDCTWCSSRALLALRPLRTSRLPQSNPVLQPLITSPHWLTIEQKSSGQQIWWYILTTTECKNFTFGKYILR